MLVEQRNKGNKIDNNESYFKSIILTFIVNKEILNTNNKSIKEKDNYNVLQHNLNKEPDSKLWHSV